MERNSIQSDSPPQRLRDIRQQPLQLLDWTLAPGAGEADNPGAATVVEHLRLQVPAASRQAWLEAERQTWEPWLRQQRSFLRREVLWDSSREEGVLLIHWASREDWKAIPEAEVLAVQASFEATAKRLLALPSDSVNPFPLVGAGEALQP